MGSALRGEPRRKLGGRTRYDAAGVNVIHPLERIPAGRRKLVFLECLGLTVVLWLVLHTIAGGLATGAAPLGLVSLELARTASEVRLILAWWTDAQVVLAGLAVKADFAFIPFYATTLALVCLWAPGPIAARGWPLSGLGRPLAWAQWIAGSLDLLENVGLLRLLDGGIRDPLPTLVAACASLKFLLVVLGLAYGLYANWALVELGPTQKTAPPSA